ncbi:uncharacterized protein LOC130828988 isoform X2 [Hippopotamus amphibius kiboko]|uniref:uncharacterized protein LOC130828988 isoform X2 n=1 Tax=Hippopotamus amphibius kiboko TaxID=575201 RepID=UPI0025984513|nr:uncharacterized protein LOC130828988 isoform X2 [Hippopotamus amphibius kiboko]
MCAINHLVANNNSACWPWVCQWRLHFASALLVGVASQACISLGPRFGAGEAPAPTRGLCGLRPPCAALPAHTRTRASRRRRRGPPATARPGAGPGNAAALGRGAGLSGRTGELPRGCGRSGEPPAADDLRAPGSPRGARRRRAWTALRHRDCHAHLTDQKPEVQKEKQETHTAETQRQAPSAEPGGAAGIPM